MPKIKSTLNLKVWRKFTEDERCTLEILLRCHIKPNEEGIYPINHKDGNIQNNRVENLEWII